MSIQHRYLKECIADAYDRLIAPAIEREIRNTLTETAEDGAIKVFGKNLRAAPFTTTYSRKSCTWLGSRHSEHGCKLAIVDATGKVLDTKVVYPTEPHNKVEESKQNSCRPY